MKLTNYLNNGGFVYGGSAGSIIFGKDIIGTTYGDENSVGLKDTKGLNLVKGYNICCHFGNGDEADTKYKRDRIKEYSTSSDITIALPENCAIYVEEETITFFGSGALMFYIKKNKFYIMSGKVNKMNYTKYTHIYKHNDLYALGLDAYIPVNPVKNMSVVIYMHGGALIWGSRETVSENEVNAIIGEKMAYISIDYRLAPETKLMDIKADIEDAIRWVQEEGVRLYNFDANRVAVLGKSAGGYLALLSGIFQNRPNAIVSFYGYGDILGDWYSLPSPYYIKSPLVSQDEAEKCITSDILTHADYVNRWSLYLRTRQTGTWASVVSGYEQSAIYKELTPYCPILNINAEYPPTFLLHGTEDTDVPVEQSEDMYSALMNMNVKAQIYIQQNGDHGFDRSWGNTPEEYGRIICFLKESFKM